MPLNESWTRTTATDLLGQSEQDSVIGSAPIHVSSQSEGDSTRYTAIIDHRVTQPEFLDILRGASPHSQTMSPGGINADWRMPDGKGAEDKRLLRLHLHLGNAWKVMMQSRHLFIEVLDAETINPFEQFEEQRLSYRTSSDFKASNIAGVALESKKTMIGILGNLPEEYWNHSFRNPDSRKLHGWSKGRLQNVFQEILSRNESPDFDKYLIAQYKKQRFTPYTVPDTDTVLYIENQQKSKGDSHGIVRRAIKGEAHCIGSYSANLGLEYDESNLRLTVDYTSVRQTPSMYPLLRWQTNNQTGHREWISEFLSPEEMEMAAARLRAGNVTEPNRLNPLLGLLTLANIGMKDVVAKWPQKMGLPEGRVKQNMSLAQAPILVSLPHLHQDILTKSPLLHELERLSNEDLDSENEKASA